MATDFWKLEANWICHCEGLYEEPYRPSSIGLEDRFTVDERKKFYEFLYRENRAEDANKKSCGSYEHIGVSTGEVWKLSQDIRSYFSKVEEKEFPMNRHFLSDSYYLLEEPLDNMPLYINSKEYRIRAIALWRLVIGK
jgi:hypothetical protein